jgi:hypothetical protein
MASSGIGLLAVDTGKTASATTGFGLDTSATTPNMLNTSNSGISVNVGSNGRVEFTRENQPSYQAFGLAVSSIQKSDGSVQVALVDAKPAQSYSGKQPNGKDLPDWVTVDPTTGAVTATPPAGQKAIVINITARGDDGKARVLQVEIKLNDKGQGKDNAQPAKGQPKPQASAGEYLTFSEQVNIAYNEHYGSHYGDRLIAALRG